MQINNTFNANTSYNVIYKCYLQHLLAQILLIWRCMKMDSDNFISRHQLCLDIVCFAKQSLIKNCLIQCNIAVVIYMAGLYQCNVKPNKFSEYFQLFFFFCFTDAEKKKNASSDFQN